MHMFMHYIDGNGRKLIRELQKYKPSLDGSKNIQGTPPLPTPLLPSSGNLDFCSTDLMALGQCWRNGSMRTPATWSSGF